MDENGGEKCENVCLQWFSEGTLNLIQKIKQYLDRLVSLLLKNILMEQKSGKPNQTKYYARHSFRTLLKPQSKNKYTDTDLLDTQTSNELQQTNKQATTKKCA